MASDTPRDYPAHLIEDAVLGDGTPVRIRPIRAEDLASHARFVDGLSFETSFARLLSPRKPQPDELQRWTDIDYDTEFALVATIVQDGTETEIGVARFVKSETSDAEVGSAEFAIVIADAWQRRGVAGKLLKSLVAAASAAGVLVLSDVTLYDNRKMLGLARKLGFRLRRDPGNANLTRLTLRL